MPSERIQRQIDRLLDEAEQAMAERQWERVRTIAGEVLALDETNTDAGTFLKAAERVLGDEAVSHQPSAISTPAEAAIGNRQSAVVSTAGPTADARLPTAFVSGRYIVKRFLGEGGKKQVYLAHDELLDRNVAFALIKTDGLDDIGRARIKREAQAMGRLGSHPHIVSVFDMGDESGQPYIVTELMAGGDIEGLIEKAPEHRLPLERTLEIGIAVCRGLEFAHGHGIVHRDLKPGNVWLTESYQPSALSGQHPPTAPVAKLGDFGLAVALDRSRLTQAGMMVGTVSYMPPEQAMGGEVTPQSDLYSLGAMLYEMVTGRRPFIGDESVAIITQHLNVAPVSPTWHNPSVPAGLEALILRLLEKDPSKRPTSATEVGAMLGSIAQAAEGGTSLSLAGEGRGEGEARAGADAQAAPANPMYRRTFVGREQEVQQLQHAFDAATSGQGSLVMVVGEPGIGKTTLCEQLATYAVIRGGRTLVGHCYEEGSLSLPYLPFVETMRSYVLAREPDGLRQDLGAGAGEVARIVSEVRERLQVEPNASTADPEEERYRLFQAISAFLQNAAAVQPLVIVLEDLHDADRGTLELLTHMSRNLAGTRLLLVGTYRDIEVDRAHPLSATLAELRRSASFSRVLLRGLTADEVQRMLSTIAGQEVAWRLAEAVHRQTEGNPLFVQEVLRYLVEEGLIRREAGRWRRASGETPLEMGIPEGLRDVIGKRLARLRPECNRLLAIAAVIGRDFTLVTLQRVSARSADELVDTLEEAVRTAVLTEQERVGEVRYRFAHAFFRQTLYEELGAARRIRFHQQVARALEEQFAGRLGEHAAELAEHFAHSSDRADLAKAVQYAQAAAQRSSLVYAYGEAVRHLEQALDVQEVLDPDDAGERCDLLLALGEALLPAGEPQRVLEAVAPQALELAKQLGNQQQASRACQQALLGVFRHAGTAAFNTPDYRRWAEEADRYAAPGSVDRVLADCAISSVLYFADRQQEAWSLLQRARVLAETLRDGGALSRIAAETLNRTWFPEHQADRLLVAEQVFLRHGTEVSFQSAGFLLFPSFSVFLASGDRPRAEEMQRRLRELAERTRDISHSVDAAGEDITLLALDGQLEAAAKAGDELRMRGDQLGIPGLGRNLARRVTLWPLLHLGRAAEALANEAASDRRLVEEGGSVSRAATTTLCLAYAGRPGEAQPYLDQLRGWQNRDGQALRLNISSLVNYLAAAVTVRDRELAAPLRERLLDAAMLVTEVYSTVIARHLGAASALVGERGQARQYYEQALEVAGKIRFRPEIALTHLQLAELLLEDADETQRAEALGHLDFAIGELRDMKMQPALERALRHKAVLKA